MNDQTEPVDTTMSIKEVMDALGISERTAYRWAAEGRFPNVKVGGRFVVNRKRFWNWFDEKSAVREAAHV